MRIAPLALLSCLVGVIGSTTVAQTTTPPGEPPSEAPKFTPPAITGKMNDGKLGWQAADQHINQALSTCAAAKTSVDVTSYEECVNNALKKDKIEVTFAN